jgi:hypothetical protein
MIGYITAKLSNLYYLALLIGAVFVLLITFVAPVNDTGSDPLLSLFVSQAIIERGTIRLNSYYEEDPTFFYHFEQQTIHQGRHLYYRYPTGPSLLAIPLVWIALRIGWDMREIPRNMVIQRILASVVSASIFLVMGLIAFSYLPAKEGMIVTTITFWGSSLISTLGVAFWNMGPTVLCVSLTLLIIARYENKQEPRINGFMVGLLLFAAYLCRPSAAIFILVIFGYLFFRNKTALYQTVGVSFGAFLLFLIFSKLEYGDWLPYYYASSSWFHSGDIITPLYGLTFGPSRGLFIFSPFFLIIVLGSFYYFGELRYQPLFWACAFWIGFQTITVATTRQWWGGFSFGPRLLTDSLPALFIMTLILWQTVRAQVAFRKRLVWGGVYITLGLVGILINTGQGLFGMKANQWNVYPNIDQYPDYLFDWRYPQFLMTAELFHERREQHYRRLYADGDWSLKEYVIGEVLEPSLYHSSQAAFLGWYPLPNYSQGTELHTNKIMFTLGEIETDRQYSLIISATSFGLQQALISINDQELGYVIFQGEAQTEEVFFDGRFLKPRDQNIVEFHLPDARYPVITDPNFPELLPDGRYSARDRLHQKLFYSFYHRLGLRDVTVAIVADELR